MSETPENPPRWVPDPTGRHEYRYWDGGAWTDHVADRGMAGTDPLAAIAADTAGAAVARTTASGGAPRVVGAADPTAVMGRRYLAFFIDALISLVAFSIIFIPFAQRRTIGETLQLPGCYRTFNSDQVQCDNRTVVTVGDNVYEMDGGAFFALSIVFTFLYFALLEGLTGGTPGKRATGLRVVREDGSIEGLAAGIIRWLLFAIDGPLSLFLCGIIMSAATRGHRRLGDVAARTYVVATSQVGSAVQV